MAVGRFHQVTRPDRMLGLWLLLTACHVITSELVPSFVEEPSSVVVKGLDSVVLRCKVTPSTATIRWLHKGKVLATDPVGGIIINQDSMQINAFKKSRHEGLYYCIAVTSVGQIRSSPAMLSAPSLGEFTSGADVHVNVTVGNTAVLPCLPPKSNPKAKIMFAFKSGFVPEDERHRILSSGNLNIASVTMSDEGVYRCVAVNTVSGRNRTSPYRVHLKVNAPTMPLAPSIQTGQTNLTVAVGSDALFECSASGNPTPSLHWNRYGGVISSRSKKILGNLLIQNVDVRDAGTYICSVNSSSQSVQKIFTLDVQVPPVVHILNPNIVKEEGEAVTIECRVQSLYNKVKPAIKWFHNSQDLAPALINGAKVNIEQLELSDAGLYQCVAIGKSGMVSAVARLEVRPAVVKRTGLTGQGGQPKRNRSEKTKSRGSRRRVGAGGHRHKKKKKHRKKKKGRKPNRDRGTKVREGKVKMVPPSKPEVTQLGNSTVMINWTVPVNDGLKITFFRIQYKELKPQKGDWQTIEEDIPKKNRTYKVRSLKPGHTYKFRITAVYTNQDNRFGPNSKRFTMEKGNLVPPAKPVIAEVKPYKVDNNYSLQVTWQYTSEDGIPISGFYLEYAPYKTDMKDKDYTRLLLPEPRVRHYVIKNLKSGTDYDIRIKGFNEAGEGKYSFSAVKSTLGKELDPIFPSIGTHAPQPVPKWVTNATTVQAGAPDHVMARQTTPHYKPSNTTESSSEMLYMVLGIVLGVLMLALIVFMVMCGIKQRQQRPMMAAHPDNIHIKYQDPAHRIYVDSMGKKYMNGGFALNGINGTMPNGHSHYYHGDRQKMNISVNPLSDMELSHKAENPAMQQQQQQQPGMPASPAVSDNNCNSIRSNNKNVSLQNGGTDPSRYMGGNSCADDDEQRSSVSGSNESQSSTSSLPDYRHCLAMHSNPDNPPHCCSCSHSRLNQSRPENSLQPSANPQRPTSGSSSNGSHHHHHRRRRKHRSCQEHSTRDQATNTDLSSNEGTMDSSSIPELTKDRPPSSLGDMAESCVEGTAMERQRSPSPHGVGERDASPSHHLTDNSHDT
ncbi:cell adhesion molecule-related/down-regulated by oncogenes-like isoform X2 [Liolophura sinensis]|uniref:cell adhesion molecule-related/down-regulated by oncogenes-like isoform X2 n=1 Tax=Liolophura sinensis TaxID=3198878 RepID=UPI003158F4B7